MKNILLLLFAACQVTVSLAQQLAFQMTFVDAKGNTDSITLGYDAAATDNLDAAFNEINILGTPYAAGLDVRIGNAWFQQQFNSYPIFNTFETKKQIVPDFCGGNFFFLFPISTVNIVSAHFPVTAYWSKNLFNDSCGYGSIFTGIHPGGWWDTGGFIAQLAGQDAVTFDKDQYYLNGTDTVHVFWVAFADSTLLTVGITELMQEQKALHVYPNPASDIISVSMGKNHAEDNRIDFYNSFGQVVLSSAHLKDIDVSHLASGCYLVRATNSKGEASYTKLLKMNRH